MITLIFAAVLVTSCPAMPQNLGKVILHRTTPLYHHQPAIQQPHINHELTGQSGQQVAAGEHVHQFYPQFRHGQSTPDSVYPDEARSFRVPVAILTMSQQSTYDGNFNYDFLSEDGTESKTSGTVRSIEGSDAPAQVMRGSYSYRDPDGMQVITNWYADETGFHAEGSHLPVAPPVPPEIQRSLEYLKSLPPSKEEIDDFNMENQHRKL